MGYRLKNTFHKLVQRIYNTYIVTVDEGIHTKTVSCACTNLVRLIVRNHIIKNTAFKTEEKRGEKKEFFSVNIL